MPVPQKHSEKQMKIRRDEKLNSASTLNKDNYNSTFIYSWNLLVCFLETEN